MTGFLQGAYFEGLDMGQIIADCVKSAGSSCADLEHFVQVTNAYPYETSWCVVDIFEQWIWQLDSENIYRSASFILKKNKGRF